tara:strand:- start:14464 stop:14793 length:330 start_codon:yes stop_codon:yes gene_type:complete
MNNYYPNLIQSNPVVPFKVHGFASDRWCNYAMTTNASIAEFHISVYANTASDARFYAEQLKTHIHKNPMLNTYINHPDDISIGMRQPVIDQLSSAYKVDMILMTGALTI